MNIDLAEYTIKKLVNNGVQTFCVAPGGRCAPFIEVLSCAKNLEVLYFFDERSAGFFAIGRSERDKKPVALVTTSGTALAELLPSAIESYYSGFPLVFLTSDRPVSYGEKGCPQTLKNPLEIFKGYVKSSFSIIKQEDLNLDSWSPQQGSLHLNVSFQEPLLDRKCTPLHFEQPSSIPFYPSRSLLKKSSLDSFFKISKKPLLLIGGLRQEEQSSVRNFLKDYKGFVYAEPFSCINPCKNILLSGERILSFGEKEKIFDGVIRLGSLPRCRFWRNLENNSLPVLNLSSPPFYPGISRSSFNSPLQETLPLLNNYKHLMEWEDQDFKNHDRHQFKQWQEILKSYPESEPHWVKILQDSLPENSSLFLGNSLPIRLWDLVCSSEKSVQLRGQAGVNGIDGLISRFLGGCDPSKENIALIGDLSALYDFSALWKAKERLSFTLIIMNNFGGHIFSQLFSNPSFLNQHKLDFAPMAKMWDLEYQLFQSSSLFSFKGAKKPLLIEIRPDENSTKECLRAYKSLWKTD